MKQLLYALLSTLAASTSGCATYSQMFVNANGQVMQCAMTGAGLLGIAAAQSGTAECSKNMRAAGYLEIERAGVVGVYLTETRDTLSILKVVPGSPADSVGIRAGDRLLGVDGQKVSRQPDATILMFGEAGSTVEVVVERDGAELHKVIRRAPYSVVIGRQPQSPPRPRSGSAWGVTR